MKRLIYVAFGLVVLSLGSQALAQGKGSVTMAAYGGGQGETWREVMGKPFAAATSISVTISDLPNTEAAIRASAQNPQYNVAWVGYFQAENLNRDGLIETFDIKDFPELKNVPERFLLKDANGRLLGVPVQFQWYGIAFNTNLAKASDFTSWSSLADPKWKGKLSQPQAFVAGSYDLVMLARVAGGDEHNVAPGLPAFRAYTQNALTIMTSFAQGNTLLSRGEITAVPFYSGRIRALKKENASVDIVMPAEGGVLLPYMLVVPKGAKDKDAYMAWLRYATQADGQLKMFDKSGYIPFNTSKSLSPEQIAELGMPMQQLLDRLYVPNYKTLADNIKEITATVEQIQAAKK